jgi:heterotetrameric sarcosine oxidase delta subunit
MRIPCPICGSRDRREFYYYGTEDYLNRPTDQGTVEDLDNHLFLRDNPAGVTRDIWYHEMGCTAWMIVTRNTITHEVLGSELVANRKKGAQE